MGIFHPSILTVLGMNKRTRQRVQTMKANNPFRNLGDFLWCNYRRTQDVAQGRDTCVPSVFPPGNMTFCVERQGMVSGLQ